jgi:hypothetical protein
MAHQFCHLELHTNDRHKAKGFYERLFGWRFEDIEVPGMGTYTTFDAGGGSGEAARGGPGGGITQMAGPGAPTMWLPYVLVEDVERFAVLARELGGRVVTGPIDIPHAGRLAVLEDPSGAVFGIWQSAQQNQDRERIKDPVYEK